MPYPTDAIYVWPPKHAGGLYPDGLDHMFSHQNKP
jgi:hypothetical protein